MRSYWLTLVPLMLSNGQSALAVEQDFAGTWKLNVQESRFGSVQFKAGTITIDHVPEAAKGIAKGHVSADKMQWTQEFVDVQGKYQARDWAGQPDGQLAPYQSNEPGTMSARRRDARTLELSILPRGRPAISATCSLSADGSRLSVHMRSGEANGVDIWILDRWTPADIDLQVLRRADELLGNASDWDRNGGRDCPAGAQKLSLFCALKRAQTELTQGYEHRAPSMQEVRKVVDEIVEGRDYKHRLADYNNDAKTSFADIKAVLRVSIERIARQLRGSGK